MQQVTQMTHMKGLVLVAQASLSVCTNLKGMHCRWYMYVNCSKRIHVYFCYNMAHSVRLYCFVPLFTKN